MAEHLLVGDVGGTRARFGIADPDGALSAPVVLDVAGHADGADALATALDRLGAPRVAAVRLAVAGVVERGSARLTNGDWRFDSGEVARWTGAESVELFNDAQAAALALPHLPPKSLTPLGPSGILDSTRPLALLTVGTGLGVSCLTPRDRGWEALATEAGHATLPAADEEEARVIARLRRDRGHVAAETVLSGRGLGALHAAMLEAGPKPPEDIVADALAGRAPDMAVLDRFCAFLGGVAGDLALGFGAWGGVAIGGGVPRRFAGFLPASPFRRRFEAKGRFMNRLRRVPTVLVERDDIALVGLARHVRER